MTRREHLSAALVALYRSEHVRLGYLRDDYLGQAADHLRDAGLPDLAERCDEEHGFGGPGEDVIARVVQAELDAEMQYREAAE